MLDPLLLLPHRPPFRLLDRVLAHAPGVWAAAVKSVDDGDPFLDEHGVWPASLLVEVMAQTSGIAAANERTGNRAMIAAIHRCRCRALARRGDQLLAMARVVRTFGAIAMVHASLRCGPRRCAAAEILLRFG